ncbi:MAG: ThiF family adenylyltransferase, partial [Sphingobacteriaceae bacterium]
METQWMERTKLLVGEKGIEKLINAHVLVVGLGGVGGYAAEAICRAGVGKMTIIDG